VCILTAIFSHPHEPRNPRRRISDKKLSYDSAAIETVSRLPLVPSSGYGSGRAVVDRAPASSLPSATISIVRFAEHALQRD